VTGFTLDQMAAALRGMPRDAPILLQLPDGRLGEIEGVRPTHVSARDGGLEAEAHGAVYAIVLVAAAG